MKFVTANLNSDSGKLTHSKVHLYNPNRSHVFSQYLLPIPCQLPLLLPHQYSIAIVCSRVWMTYCAGCTSASCSSTIRFNLLCSSAVISKHVAANRPFTPSHKGPVTLGKNRSATGRRPEIAATTWNKSATKMVVGDWSASDRRLVADRYRAC